MFGRTLRGAAIASAVTAATVGLSAAAVSAHSDHHGRRGFGHHHAPTAIKHVLLISVDGMHQSDLDWYVQNHPDSELAKLADGGAEFTNNHTSDPSDSDPGGTALMTGGDPRATGIYYDDEYSHGVFPPGTTNCSGPIPGGNVIYDSPDDNLANVPDLLNNGSGNTFPSFDEGGSIYSGNGGASGAFPGDDTNPALIMNLSDHPQSGLNPATYPVDPRTCKPIQPWDYVQVNTIFQVIHNAGMRTAWSDKHAIYTSFNGPGSGGKASTTSSGRRSTRRRSSRTAFRTRRTARGRPPTPRPSNTTRTRSRRSSTGSTATTTPAPGRRWARPRSTG